VTRTKTDRLTNTLISWLFVTLTPMLWLLLSTQVCEAQTEKEKPLKLAEPETLYPRDLVSVSTRFTSSRLFQESSEVTVGSDMKCWGDFSSTKAITDDLKQFQPISSLTIGNYRSTVEIPDLLSSRAVTEKLSRLDISVYSVSDLSQIKDLDLPSLVSLRVFFDLRTDQEESACINHLIRLASNFSALQDLSVSGLDLSNVDIEQLVGKIPVLQRLDIRFCVLSPKFLEKVIKLGSVKEIHLRLSTLDSLMIKVLRKRPSLKVKLWADCAKNDLMLVNEFSQGQIVGLHLVKVKFSHNELEVLNSLATSLKELELSGERIIGFSDLKTSELQTLSLLSRGSRRFQFDLPRNIARNLKNVRLEGVNFVGDDDSFFTSLEFLRGDNSLLLNRNDFHNLKSFEFQSVTSMLEFLDSQADLSHLKFSLNTSQTVSFDEANELVSLATKVHFGGDIKFCVYLPDLKRCVPKEREEEATPSPHQLP